MVDSEHDVDAPWGIHNNSSDIFGKSLQDPNLHATITSTGGFRDVHHLFVAIELTVIPKPPLLYADKGKLL